MTDVFDRIRAANPIPDTDRYFESVTGKHGQLLGSIRDRRDRMTVEEITKLEQPKPRRTPPSFGGWKVAVAGAAAVVALVVAGSVLLTGGDKVAGPTDGLSNVEIGELFVAHFEAGNVAGYEALLAPDAGFGTIGGAPDPYFGTGDPSPQVIWSTASLYLAATHGTHTSACTEPSASNADVICDLAESTIFHEVGGINPNRYSWSFVIDDGLVNQLTASSSLQITERLLVREYAEWVQVNYPSEHAGLIFGVVDFGGSELTLLNTDSAEQRARHLELTTEWAASRG